MSIRKQTFAIIALTLLVATIAFFVITRSVLLHQFELLEERQVMQRVESARNEILVDLSTSPAIPEVRSDDATFERLENLLQAQVALRTLDDPLPISVERLRQESVVTFAADENTISGYTLLTGQNETRATILEVTIYRHLYQQARSALLAFMLTILLAGGLAGTWFGLLLDRVILSRMSNLKRDIDTIRSEQKLDGRVRVRGRDELAGLALAVNELLTSLENAQIALTRARDDALLALETKNQLLANISHDARTPLSVIMLRAENMERGVYGPLTTRQREVLAGMKASANQMLFFVNNLLASAKLKTGMMQLASEPIDVLTFLADVRTLMEPLAAEHGVELIAETDIEPGFIPYGDADRIKQIVFNLIDNAIKFTDSGGTITLNLSNVARSRWVISVQDTGRGIPDDEKHHIFDAFYQVEAGSTRAAAAGVGLGLSIVRQLTSLMEGKIEVRSVVGIGTTFVISLPSRAPRVETQEMLAID